jgi:dTDP-4-dehydrorhamnose 3,5-epimerase
MHMKQIDNVACIHGMMKVVLYDDRKDSATYKEINEFFIGIENPLLISIPPLVYHGFKAIGTKTAFFLNIPSDLYDYKKPDEYRLPPDTDKIPYDWVLVPGLKHG